MKAVSLFSSSGVGEAYLQELGVDVIVANELLDDRATLYSKIYPDSKMICGDITDKKIFNELVTKSKGKIDLVIATPPCQGISIAGKNRKSSQMTVDPRNSLVLEVLKFIDIKQPDFVLIENVPGFLKVKIPYHGDELEIIDILKEKYSDTYVIDFRVLNTSEYGIPQYRKRAIIKMYKMGKNWPWPVKSKKLITVRDAIAHLPSLESGEDSGIAFHYARKHTEQHIHTMAHTPTNKSAHDNSVWYPKNKYGQKVKGYNTTYRRIAWDEPSPTITMRNDAISSQKNVHPGRQKSDGTYSDARVLTPLELMILDSVPRNWNLPIDTPELIIRKILGESVPPLMIKKIFSQINK